MTTSAEYPAAEYPGADLAQAEAICVLIHGRGQSPADMRDMVVTRLRGSDTHAGADGQDIAALAAMDPETLCFALPAARGGSWYDARAIDPLTPATRSQLATGQAQLTALIADLRAARPGVPLLLAGFSQGACMAVEYLMTAPDLPEAAALFTGCRVGLPGDDLPRRDLSGLPVYASCGDDDPWVPADAYFRMLSDLTGAGARLRADIFPGRAHTVADTEITALSGLLHALRDGTPAFGGGAA